MEKHFVTYKQALALKEIGFDVTCLYSYYQDGTIASELKSINWNLSDTLCSAPIKSQVFEWFDTTAFTDIDEKPFKLRGIITHKETGYFGCEIRTWRFDNNVGKWKREMSLKSEQYRNAIESYVIDKLIEIAKAR